MNKYSEWTYIVNNSKPKFHVHIFVRTDVMSRCFEWFLDSPVFPAFFFHQFYTFTIWNFLMLKTKGIYEKKGFSFNWYRPLEKSFMFLFLKRSLDFKNQQNHFTIALLNVIKTHLPSWHIDIWKSSWTCHCYQTMRGEFLPCHYTWDDVLKSSMLNFHFRFQKTFVNFPRFHFLVSEIETLRTHYTLQ